MKGSSTSSLLPFISFVVLLRSPSVGSLLPPKCALYTPTGIWQGPQTCFDPTAALCGINRTSGHIQGCISASLCPSPVADQNFVCNSSTPSCCCKDTNPDDLGNLCNNILNSTDDTLWNQACSLPELQSTAICQLSPVETVYCAINGDNSGIYCPGHRRYCGINRKTGRLQGCVHSSECPDTVPDSKVVCHPDKPSCCCRGPKNETQLACNNILSWTDTSVWQQACSLPELKTVKACQSVPVAPPPPKPPHTEAPLTEQNMEKECLAYCRKEKPNGHHEYFSIICNEGGIIPGLCPEPCPKHCGHYCYDGMNLRCPPLSPPTPAPPTTQKPKKMVEAGLGTTAIALISVAMIFVLVIIGGLIYYVDHKRRKQHQVEHGEGTDDSPGSPEEENKQPDYIPHSLRASIASSASSNASSVSDKHHHKR